MTRWLPRALLVPAAWYLAIALLVPLLNGAGSEPGFWTHAAVVVGTVFGLILVAAAATRITLGCGIWRRIGRSAER